MTTYTTSRPTVRLSLNYHTIVKPDQDKVIPRWLYYYLLARKDTLIAWAGGTAQKNLLLRDLRAFELVTPSLPIQRKIASILSAYDNLIENNVRRIKILEEIAQNLYRQWFIRFHFPSDAEIHLVGSSRGRMPRGWRIVNLLEIADVKYGKNLAVKQLVDDGLYPVYGAAKIIGRHSEYTREHRTIITGCRGSVGSMQITKPFCLVTNNAFTFDPGSPNDFFWLYHALKERGFRDVIGGAAQPQITIEGISSVQLITPSEDLRKRFHDAVAGFYALSWNLESSNENLRQTRDLLLPKLVSGDLDVAELGIAIPEETT